MLIISKKTNEVIRVSYDETPESPLEWDRLGVLRLFNDCVDDSKDYQKHQSSYEALNELIKGGNSLSLRAKFAQSELGFFKEIEKLGKENGYYIQPVTCFQHDSVKYYVGVDRGWDFGVVGFIYARFDKISRFFQLAPGTLPSLEKVNKIFQEELDNYTDYANGDVYEIDYYASAQNIDDTDDYLGSIYDDSFTVDSDYCDPDNIKSIVQEASYYFGIKDNDPKNWTLAKVKHSAMLSA